MTKIEMIPPAAPLRIVFIMIFEVDLDLSKNKSAVEPPLKNSQEIHRIIVPTTMNGIEFGS